MSPKHPKVLIFSSAYYPFVGGAEVAVKEITDRLPDIKFDLITIRYDARLPRLEHIGNVTVYRVGWGSRKPKIRSRIYFPFTLNKYIYPPLAFLRAVRLNRRYKYSAIWSIMASYSGFAALLFKLFHPKMPYLLSLQEGDPLAHIKRRTRFIHPIFKMVFTKASIIQVISNYLGDFARDMGYEGEVVLVPNGVDYEKFSRELSFGEEENLLSEMGKRSHTQFQDEEETVADVCRVHGDIFVITASRLVRKNGVDCLIKTMKYLPACFKLLIAGTGSEMTNLKILADSVGVSHKIKWLGHVPHSKLVKYLKVSDVFVRPSRSEGFGNSFVEAMATGLPVIATPVGGIVDFINDPQKNADKEPTGLFCEVDNPQDVAKKIVYIMNNRELRERIIQNGQTLAREDYDWSLIADKMEKEVFSKVIKE